MVTHVHKYVGLGQLRDAEQYLAQAQWVVLQTSDCAPSIKSRLHRDLGLLFMAQGDGQGSKKHFAEDVSTIYASAIIPTNMSITCCHIINCS